MKLMKTLLTTALAFALIVPSAYAYTAESTLKVGVMSAGSLEMTVPNEIVFPTVEYKSDFLYAINSNVGEVVVTDSRGTGEGWILSVESSELKEVGGKGLTFGNGSLLMYAPAGAYNDTSTDNAPVVTTTTYASIQNAPFTLVTASPGQGSGVWRIPLGSIEIASNAVYPLVDEENYPNGPTPYEATLTFSLVTGP